MCRCRRSLFIWTCRALRGAIRARKGRTGRGGRPLIVLSVAAGGRESGVVHTFGRELQI